MSVYDSTDIHAVYNASRSLPPEVIDLWLEAVARAVSGRRFATIVDLGCGTGRFTSRLAPYFDADVIGVDPSRSMLSVAAANVPGTIPLLEGSAEAIPVPDSSVDLLFLSMVYHHIQDKEKAAAELRHVLAPRAFSASGRSRPIRSMTGSG